MRISTRTWHGRVYRFWANHPENSRRWHLGNPERRQENLCHYVRVILLWAPLFWLAFTRPTRHAWFRPVQPVAVALLAAVGTVSYMRWPKGSVNVLLAVAITAGVAAVCSIVAVLVSLGLQYLVALQRERRNEPERTSPTFVKVAWEFAKAKKSRVCPLIEIVDHTKERT